MTVKIKISPVELAVLSSFGQLPFKVQDELFSEVDSDNRESIMRAIRKHIAPSLAGWERTKPGFRNRLKYALWFFIHQQPWNPEDVFGRLEPIINEPENVLDYYRWAWEELFAGEEKSMPAPTYENFEVIDSQ